MNEFLDIAREICGPDWEVEDDSVLRCPHGHLVEWDGECPEGCESPIRAAGMI